MASVVFPLFAGMFDNAWIKGTTDKNPLSYKTGEEMVFTLELQSVDGDIPDGEYTLWWKRSDDFGATEEGTVPLTKTPFVYRTKLENPGFVRLEAYVVDKDGNRVVKKFTGDTSTPEGRKAMNEFERKKKNVFFDGGAGVEFNIKEGPITMMSLGLKADGSFKFIVAEGESLAGPIPPTGNTNTHGKFPPDVRTFLRNWSMEGPTHHFALGVGHHAAELKKLGRALGIETVVVTEGQ